MATVQFFDKNVKCQSGEEELALEFGRSSYFKEDSIYLNVAGKSIVMDRETAKEFVEAAKRL